MQTKCAQVGRLTGQIEALNTKALEAIQRERVLKEQIAQAEEVPEGASRKAVFLWEGTIAAGLSGTVPGERLHFPLA